MCRSFTVSVPGWSRTTGGSGSCQVASIHLTVSVNLSFDYAKFPFIFSSRPKSLPFPLVVLVFAESLSKTVVELKRIPVKVSAIPVVFV